MYSSCIIMVFMAINTVTHSLYFVLMRSQYFHPLHLLCAFLLSLRLGTCMRGPAVHTTCPLSYRYLILCIPGNEMADTEAKRAAGGLSSDPISLPNLLKRPLPLNPSALYRKKNSEIMQHWKDTWRSSARGKLLAKVDNKPPSASFLHAISNTNLSRRSASLITQLYIGHVPLNDFLKKIKRTDSARCPACGAGSETVAHYLLECPIYAHERWILAKRLSKRGKPMTLKNLLGDDEAYIPLANFINASHRFPHDA